MSQKRYVYQFAQGNQDMKNLLGGKGANLAEMVSLGLPVPPGFTITTEACNEYLSKKKESWPALEEEILANLAWLEEETKKSFGAAPPLLVSVRSGAAVSMPGMMDTVLNLGLNQATLAALAQETGDRRFALDCYRRFIQMFAEVVLNVGFHLFDDVLTAARHKKNVQTDAELEERDLEQIVEAFLKLVHEQTGESFPVSPKTQLLMAVKAVFRSWNTSRAIVYRRANGIPDHLGTAVNIQTMVFGNFGLDSGTGVAFTRNPSTGEPGLFGEYLFNAQGEDVVAGIRTPQPIEALKNDLPAIYDEFLAHCHKLETHYRKMQDIEFTIEKGKLFMLQTRTGKRTAPAAVRIAVDLVTEGLIDKNEALKSVEPEELEQLLHRRLDPAAALNPIATGLPASPGAACGRVVFDADQAQIMAKKGIKVILVRPETTPDDIHGIIAAEGVLTSRGGMTSHAAVVARGMGKPCITGCEELKIDLARNRFIVNGKVYGKEAELTIDGTTGKVFSGTVPMIEPEMSAEFKKLLGWADQVRRLKVRANADTPEDARRAAGFGAQGIGLCRTEHMFMAPGRLSVVQKMIMAAGSEERKACLRELLPMQQSDFKGIFYEMAGCPVTVRLLDPPLHEFLPGHSELLLSVAKMRLKGAAGPELKEKEALLQKVEALADTNPMLGHRGCRLGLVYPEIYQMQVQALFFALFELLKDGLPKEKLQPEIMIPLVGHKEEMVKMKELVEATAAEIFAQKGETIPFLTGTMIELPRACLVAGELAEAASFFSFGTNDLTQTTLGYSRDDAEGKFIPFYLEQGILKVNPFAEIDVKGVGALVELAVAKGRRARPALKIGICGEHGGNPASIEFFHAAGLDYVSCSPFRLPVARLASARAAIKERTI